MKIYVLKNCDTCKKALKWLDGESIAYQNHDVRADGLSRETIANIVTSAGWEAALNRRSTTWRELDEDQKTDVDAAKAVDLIEANPTLLKRPVFVIGGNMIVGFDAKAQEKLAGLIGG